MTGTVFRKRTGPYKARNHKKEEIYTEGIGQIHFTGNMVRFDFVTLQPTGDNQEPVTEKQERIIMPPQGFLGAFDSRQKLFDKLAAPEPLRKILPLPNKLDLSASRGFIA